jgi:RNA polymerase sigma factor (TIGR02999 family)
MALADQAQVTQLLMQASGGDRGAVDALLPHVYRELRRLAGGYMKREREGHTLDATGLVHEAYMKLVDQSRVEWQNRSHFFGIAATAMRRILVDHARGRQADKRGGGVAHAELHEGIVSTAERGAELIAVDDALERLAAWDPVKSRVVELRFFGGLSIEECAEAMGISTATANRHWRMAKAWLHGELTRA